METIGTAAIIPKVADARERARVSILKAHDGINPSRSGCVKMLLLRQRLSRMP